MTLKLVFSPQRHTCLSAGREDTEREFFHLLGRRFRNVFGRGAQQIRSSQPFRGTKWSKSKAIEYVIIAREC